MLAKSAGFCWGVRRAVDTALLHASAPGARRVFTDGPLIHNSHQTKLLEESGVWECQDPAALDDGVALLIRAHGIAPERRRRLSALPLTLVDATCPDVAKIHRIIEAKAAAGACVLVYGDAGHAEVAGLLGCAGGRGRVLTAPRDADDLPPDAAAGGLALVSQTTQSPESFAEVAAAVKARFPDAEIIDTICRATKTRQAELRELAARCDAIVVIGSPASANTQRLAQIAAALKKTVIADSAEDLRADDFTNVRTAAVTAGASTPDFIIAAVIEKLNAMDAIAQIIAAALAALAQPGAEFAGMTYETVKATRETATEILNADGSAAASAVPPRSIVSLALHPAAGSTVRVEIWLPDADGWNGRFLGLGSGGMGGWLMGAGGFAPPLKQGYAVAHTDLGTSIHGGGNPEVWKDFGHRATHLMSVVGKAVAEGFYGKEISYSYFVGGSTGGQQALSLAQRHPGDYDGIVAGVPAHDRTALHAYFVWNEQIFDRCPFTESQREAVAAAGLEHMAERDAARAKASGAADREKPAWSFADPAADEADIEAVIERACKKDPSLTPAHRAALSALFRGPKRADTGARIHGGIPLGAPLWSGKDHFYPFRWVFGEDWDFHGFDFAADYDKYRAALSADLDANDAALAPFQARGGKLLMYSGALDQVVPFHPTLAYHAKVEALCGGAGAADFIRYWIIPGMGHGAGPFVNRTPDWLALVRGWREDGAAPGVVRVSRVDRGGATEAELPVAPR